MRCVLWPKGETIFSVESDLIKTKVAAETGPKQRLPRRTDGHRRALTGTDAAALTDVAAQSRTAAAAAGRSDAADSNAPRPNAVGLFSMRKFVD